MYRKKYRFIALGYVRKRVASLDFLTEQKTESKSLIQDRKLGKK